MLRVDDDALHALLAEHGDELVVQLATDPVFRGAVVRSGGRGRRRAAGRRLGRPETLSPTLRRKLGVRR